MDKKGIKPIAKNAKAFHDYFVEERYEAGVVLSGTEVKSIRQGGANLKDSWCQVKDGELWLYGVHISPYEKGNIFNKDPLRVKKLLLHRQQIRKLIGDSSEKGYTIVPLQVYFRDGRAKIEIGLARGKKLYDKRQDIARKDQRREMEKELKVRLRGN